MAIFGPFPTVRAQLAHEPRFAAAMAYVAEMLQPGSAAHRRLGQVETGASARIELAGGAFAIEQVYHTKSRSDGFFESHRVYIDVQVVVEGAEVMEVEDISRLTVSDPYLAERDLLKYAKPASASVLRAGPGDVAVFFPADGHMPTLHLDGQVRLVRKTVVKVPAG